MMSCKWMEKAIRDHKLAKLALKEGLYDESAFHSQQAAEKALKALLTALGIQPPKTHEIDILLVLLQKKGVNIEPILHARTLTRYAVEARYSDFGEEPSPEEAEEALRTAEKVVEWAKKELTRRGVKC